MSKKFARMNVIEFVSEDAFDIINERYSKIRGDTYGGIEFTLNVRTGPTSSFSLSIYENEAAIEATEEPHRAFLASNEDIIKDVFFHSGEVSSFATSLPVTEGMVESS